MQYRFFDRNQDELKKRIDDVEREHYLVSLDLAVAEGKKDDEAILQYQETITRLEKVLAVLYSQNGK
jgi:hypothetical protein